MKADNSDALKPLSHPHNGGKRAPGEDVEDRNIRKKKETKRETAGAVIAHRELKSRLHPSSKTLSPSAGEEIINEPIFRVLRGRRLFVTIAPVPTKTGTLVPLNEDGRNN